MVRMAPGKFPNRIASNRIVVLLSRADLNGSSVARKPVTSAVFCNRAAKIEVHGDAEAGPAQLGEAHS